MRDHSAATMLVRLVPVKADDTVNVKYYRSVAFRVTGPTGGKDTPASVDELAPVSSQTVQLPGGVGPRVLGVSGTVVGISLGSDGVDVVYPLGGVVTPTITDPSGIAMLHSLNAGDSRVQRGPRGFGRTGAKAGWL
jgi:hypothetical protein